MEIKKVSDFIEEIAIKDEDGKQLFFRGHASENFKLLPSLYREENFYLSEHNLYKDTMVYCPQDFINCKNSLEVLVKMRHYSIPTRLLDLTCNALVALYFACEPHKDKNGEVIILQIPTDNICYYDSDRITILANLAKQDNKFHFDYDEGELKNDKDIAVEKVNKNYFGYLLHST